jgi:hypothetical protein
MRQVKTVSIGYIRQSICAKKTINGDKKTTFQDRQRGPQSFAAVAKLIFLGQ